MPIIIISLEATNLKLYSYLCQAKRLVVETSMCYNPGKNESGIIYVCAVAVLKKASFWPQLF